MGVFRDLEGKEFDRLTVVKYAGRDKARKSLWLCRCKCGNELLVTSCSLTTKNTRSCGCLHIDTVTTHGQSGCGKGTGSPTYTSWLAMIARCTCENIPDYKLYGAKGIVVCDRWRVFEGFLADVGERPSTAYSIDRFPDNQGNYEPGNCRWATRKEQNRNKKTNIILTHDGVTACLTDWADTSGVNFSTLKHRIFKLGMTLGEAISVPVMRGGNRRHLSLPRK